jgi:hypothetical protein
MSEATHVRAAKTARSAAAGENLAAETLRTELPSSVTDVLEKGIARARDAHEKLSTILVHSTEAVEEALSCANRGSNEYRAKLMEILRDNAELAFAATREALEVKTLPEFFERALANQRKLLELATAQMKELSALTQKVVTETTEPIRNGITEQFKLAS